MWWRWTDFLICFRLPVPWFLYTLCFGQPVPVTSAGMVCSITLLFCMLMLVFFSILLFNWKMTKGKTQSNRTNLLTLNLSNGHLHVWILLWFRCCVAVSHLRLADLSYWVHIDAEEIWCRRQERSAPYLSQSYFVLIIGSAQCWRSHPSSLSGWSRLLVCSTEPMCQVLPVLIQRPLTVKLSPRA